MIEDRIIELIGKYKDNILTKGEWKDLEAWINLSMSNKERFEELLNDDALLKEAAEHYFLDKEILGELGKKFGFSGQPLAETERPNSPLYQMPRRRWAWPAAAAILMLISTVSYFFLIRNNKRSADLHSMAAVVPKDIAPGSNKAILTLANGKTIVLDEVPTGDLASQGNVKIVKLDSGCLTYDMTHEKPFSVGYNTLSTPRAGQFQVTLPDGSKVWLNNTSSLRYPTSFTGKSREVELSGEAYFEIARNTSLPFKVKINDMTVDVLGTSFNIMAYGDENSVKTTLLTGGVRVTRGSVTALLKPGEQAQLINVSGKMKVIDNVNTEGVVAWKNGFFHFDKADTRSVMRQLARWYDIEVNYEGPVPLRLFEGEIGRNLNLSQVLEGLKMSNVNFRVDGRNITVMP